MVDAVVGNKFSYLKMESHLWPATRAHLLIKKNPRWMLDVHLGEDASLAHEGHEPGNLAFIMENCIITIMELVFIHLTLARRSGRRRTVGARSRVGQASGVGPRTLGQTWQDFARREVTGKRARQICRARLSGNHLRRNSTSGGHIRCMAPHKNEPFISCSPHRSR